MNKNDYKIEKIKNDRKIGLKDYSTNQKKQKSEVKA